MRVLHVHERAGFYGGVEQILYDTAVGLGRVGWPQALWHRDPDPQPDYLAAFAQSGEGEEILSGFAPDVLLLHKTEDAALVEGLARRFPTARMVHDHDLVCLRRHKYFPLNTRVCDRPSGIACYTHLCFLQKAPPGSLLPIALARVGERKAAIRAHREVRSFLVGSRWMRRELEMNGIDPGRIEIIPPIPAALANAKPLPPVEGPEVLFVGQVIRGKGVDLLLQALARVEPPWHASLLGSGNHLDFCRQLAIRLGIGERVDFAGWVPHDELEAHYARAAIAVVPSRWPEPFGMVGIEAMARGRPVVAFAVGGIPDWLTHEVSGLLVQEADIAALAQAIQGLLRQPEHAQALGRRAAREVAERFRHEVYLEQMISILEGLG